MFVCNSYKPLLTTDIEMKLNFFFCTVFTKMLNNTFDEPSLCNYAPICMYLEVMLRFACRLKFILHTYVLDHHVRSLTKANNSALKQNYAPYCTYVHSGKRLKCNNYLQS